MFIHREFRNGGFCAMGAVWMLAFASVGMCQTEPEQESDSASSDVLEEIIVYGDKSLPSIRRELYRAEENLFAMFNSLNSKDEYDIQCDYVELLGSRKRHHICEPNFVLKIKADQANAMMSDGTGLGAQKGFYLPHWPMGVVVKKERLLWEEMAALAFEHPELREALAKLAEMNQVMEYERQRRCEGSFFIRCRKCPKASIFYWCDSLLNLLPVILGIIVMSVRALLEPYLW